MAALELLKSTRVHGGELRRYRHLSAETRTPMTFALFLPPGPPAPVLFFLSGLTCTDANFCEKAGAFRAAAAARVAILAPDTSPRGADLGVPETFVLTRATLCPQR